MGRAPDFEYVGVRRIAYNGAQFVPVCEKCGRFVKADPVVTFTAGGEGPPADRPNASCRKCGRVQMLFEGYY